MKKTAVPENSRKIPEILLSCCKYRQILTFSGNFRLRIWFENIDVKMETLELKIARSCNAAKKNRDVKFRLKISKLIILACSSRKFNFHSPKFLAHFAKN